MVRKRYPGKFEGCDDDRLAEALYRASQDGCDADCGDVNEYGWYGLILHRDHGYIVSEDGQGFFCYERYETREDALANYTRIESNLAEAYDEPEYPAYDDTTEEV
jgi:hypothetical protein